ncbi:MAG: hypothetical protein K0B52_06030, partial [FCB group bacterium]|nr:hypothetical protein [FCB group bacterium]
MKKMLMFTLAVLMILPLSAEEITPEKVLSDSFVRVYSSEKEYEKYYCSDPDGISLSFNSQDFGVRRNLRIGGEIIAREPHIGLNQVKMKCIIDRGTPIEVSLSRNPAVNDLWETTADTLIDFSGSEPGDHTLEIIFEANFTGTVYLDPENEAYKAVFNNYRSVIYVEKNGAKQEKFNCFNKEGANPDLDGHVFGEVTSMVIYPEIRTDQLDPDSVMFLYKRLAGQKTPIKVRLTDVAEKGSETVSVWQIQGSEGVDLKVENMSGGEYEFCVGYEIHLGGSII